MKNGKLTYEEEEIRMAAEAIATKLFLQVAFDEMHLTLEEANDWMTEVCVEAVKNQIVGEIMKHDPEDDFRFVKGATNDDDYQYIMARMWAIFRSNLKKGVYDFSEFAETETETETETESVESVEIAIIDVANTTRNNIQSYNDNFDRLGRFLDKIGELPVYASVIAVNINAAMNPFSKVVAKISGNDAHALAVAASQFGIIF